MKEQNKIPVSKVERAGKFAITGAKIGVNYVKYKVKQNFNPESAKAEYDKENATDIYNALSQLKGSALKVAQMLSMDKNTLPKAYGDRFAMAQYSAPPLSYPLVVKTFRNSFGKGPGEIFDDFGKSAMNAASIGQVHAATLKGRQLAVKIQYPGVADSISSDLKIVRPMAVRLFNLNDEDLDKYLKEVETMLIQETDYELELQRAVEISQACSHLHELIFPAYYPELSGKRILTMDRLPGLHLNEFLNTNPSQETRNKVGQALWDFYHFQMHELKQVHADPHPGNFLMQDDGKLGVIDFGCVKVIPEDFYKNYFALLNSDLLADNATTDELFKKLEFIDDRDTPREKELFTGLFKEMIYLLGRPFQTEEFDFGDESYFARIYDLGDRMTGMKELKNSRNARGSQHGIYVNRTYFGLYTMLNDLKAKIKTGTPEVVLAA